MALPGYEWLELVTSKEGEGGAVGDGEVVDCKVRGAADGKWRHRGASGLIVPGRNHICCTVNI